MASPTAQAAAARTRRAIMIGEQIRRLRRERGLSQAELARKAHTSQAAIARLELGDVDPKISTLDRVCEALGADLLIALQGPATASAQRAGAVADGSPRPTYSTTVAAKRRRPRSGSRK
ncbi:MAG: helix-turn-helix domain-containing protein [Dehalococcoidia bacterium]